MHKILNLRCSKFNRRHSWPYLFHNSFFRGTVVDLCCYADTVAPRPLEKALLWTYDVMQIQWLPVRWSREFQNIIRTKTNYTVSSN